jgi:hypothetical protein
MQAIALLLIEVERPPSIASFRFVSSSGDKKVITYEGV